MTEFSAVCGEAFAIVVLDYVEAVLVVPLVIIVTVVEVMVVTVHLVMTPMTMIMRVMSVMGGAVLVVVAVTVSACAV